MRSARKAGLPMENPLGMDGRFRQDTGLVGGLHVEEADQRIPGLLAERGMLLCRESYRHSYRTAGGTVGRCCSPPRRSGSWGLTGKGLRG